MSQYHKVIGTPPTSKLGMLLLKKGILRGETEMQPNEF